MADRPIIFSAPMVRALLEGRKTMTRRLVKRGWVRQMLDAGMTLDFINDPGNARGLPYQPGDRLWVREAWGTYAGPGIRCCEHDRPNVARATGGYSPVTFRVDAEGKAWGMYGPPKWRSPIHMPRRASRLTLTVTAVRVERLQDISEADAVAEGVPFTELPQGRTTPDPLHRGQFADLWNSLHGPAAWEANPEVVVLTFTVRKGNIDDGR